MEVWAVIYEPFLFSDDIYQRCLSYVDNSSAERIRRFYRREDACRTLIGRLLPRVLYKRRGLPLKDILFATTATGKPYLVTTQPDPAAAFNVTHDSGLVVIASSMRTANVGVDVMRVHIPRRESFSAFVTTLSEQLTAHERDLIHATDEETGLRRFFWMWTLKEAYTKALGIGIGFDFKRVEFDPVQDIVKVDGIVPQGWLFTKLEIPKDDEFYQCVVAEELPGAETHVLNACDSSSSLSVYQAAEFAESAMKELGT